MITGKRMEGACVRSKKRTMASDVAPDEKVCAAREPEVVQEE